MKAIKHVAAAVVAVLAVMLAALIATVTLIVADTANARTGPHGDASPTVAISVSDR